MLTVFVPKPAGGVFGTLGEGLLLGDAVAVGVPVVEAGVLGDGVLGDGVAVAEPEDWVGGGRAGRRSTPPRRARRSTVR